MIADRADPASSPVPARRHPAARAVVARLGISAAEATALAVLATGAVLALGLLWWLARPVPVDAPGAVPSASGGLALVGPSAAPSPTELVVHVSGQVAAPGVYRVAAGARVGDALALAGGPLPDAALQAVNLARPLADGEQVVVPSPGEAAAPAPAPAPGAAPGGAATPAGGAAPAGGTAPAGGAVRPDGTVDLNLATVADLDELPGVGPVLAQRIVDHRAAIGRFSDVAQLREVSGIGEQRFQDLAPLVAV